MSKGLRVFGHPLHAILSDLPAAFLGTSLLWDVIGLWRGEPVWWAISFWTIAAGLAFAVLAALAGMIDFAAIPEKHPAQQAATRHMLLMIAALAPYCLSLVVRHGPAPPAGKALIGALALEAVGVLLLSAGGWYGGHLVFHYGVGHDAREGE